MDAIFQQAPFDDKKDLTHIEEIAKEVQQRAIKMPGYRYGECNRCGGKMTQAQELALYRVVFSLPHHQRRLALARKIIEQGGPLTPDYKEYRTSLRLCNQMLDDPRLGDVLGKG